MKRTLWMILAVLLLFTGCGNAVSTPEQTAAQEPTPASGEILTATLTIGVTCGSGTVKGEITAQGAAGESYTFAADEIEEEVLKIPIPDGYTLTNSEARDIAVPYGETKAMYFIAESNQVPTPEPTPEPTVYIQESIVYTGKGDSVIELDEFDGIYVFRITGNEASRHFAVWGYDENAEKTELLVNTSEPYSGTTMDTSLETKMLEITASGEWTVEVMSVSSMDIITAGDTYSGSGDSILLMRNYGQTATISGNEISQHFAVWSHGSISSELMVNTSEPYEGTVMLKGDPLILQVTAVGDWSITLN